MVALSGGKDSYTLFDLLWRAHARAPFDFELVGVHLDQGQPGYDGAPLIGWLERFGKPFEIVHRDTYSKVIEVVPAGKKLTQQDLEGLPGCTVCMSWLAKGIVGEIPAKK